MLQSDDDLTPETLAQTLKAKFGLVPAELTPDPDELGKESRTTVTHRFTPAFIAGQRERALQDRGTPHSDEQEQPSVTDLWQCTDDLASTRHLRLRISLYMSGVNAETLAERLDIDAANISYWVKGSRKIPNDRGPAVARELGVSTSWLMTDGTTSSARQERKDIPSWLAPWRKAFQESYALCRHLFSRYPEQRDLWRRPGTHRIAIRQFLDDDRATLPETTIDLGIPSSYWTPFIWECEGSYLCWFDEAAQFHHLFHALENKFGCSAETLLVLERMALELLKRGALDQVSLLPIEIGAEALAKGLRDLAYVIEESDRQMNDVSSVSASDVFLSLSRVILPKELRRVTIANKKLLIDTSDPSFLKNYLASKLVHTLKWMPDPSE